MRTLVSLGALVACAAFAAPATAGDIEWLPSLDKGIDAAKKSGRAILYVTLWKKGT